MRFASFHPATPLHLGVYRAQISHQCVAARSVR